MLACFHKDLRKKKMLSLKKETLTDKKDLKDFHKKKRLLRTKRIQRSFS